MSAFSSIDEPSHSAALRETLELRLLETTARYLYVNSLPLPLVILGLTPMFWHWSSLALAMSWMVASLVTWAGLGLVLYRFLHDNRRAGWRREWTAGIAVSIFVAVATFSSAALLFWAPGDRINNVLLYVLVAASMATASGQAAPTRVVLFANLSPYAAVFVTTSLLHERYPYNFGFVALEIFYLVLVVMFARAVRQLAYEMLLLREQKRALISRLEDALFDATVARKRAETASRAKSQFLANMSHELRTPLNAVLGFSEVIRDRLFGDGALLRYSDYAANIHTSGTHLLGLINDVLDLSKIEAGKLELVPERFDLVGDAVEALRLVEPQAARKNVHLARDMPETLSVFADKRALRQIAVNLLANAVKFTPPGGSVTLSLRVTLDRSIALAVTDTGIGIRPEDMTRVLESFGQGRHDITPSDEHGTGLGLAIAKSLIEAHGGTIGIESELGEGTAVTVTLPQKEDSLVEAA